MDPERPDTSALDGEITPEEMTWISKVPEITLIFWIIKIFCTTVGETGGDAVTMSWLGETTEDVSPFMHTYGYLIGTAIFLIPFVIAVSLQIKAKKFHPFLYWFTIVATTTVGTTLADFSTRSIGIGYPGGSLILLACVVISLIVWKAVTGTVAIASVRTPRSEMFYWLTIMFSQTLGTALGDWFAGDADEGGIGIGYLTAAGIFVAALLIVVLLKYFTSISRTMLFWIAFVLTRPLGATVGDFLDKPHEDGGLELSRTVATFILLAVIIVCILVFPQRPATAKH
jgi:uncharacterized membrane-anchored protein